MEDLKKNRFENLDQWRAWALIFVLVNHGFKHTGLVEGLGRSGVNLFFVISGMLTAMSIQSLNRRGLNYFVALPVKRFWRLVPTLIIFFVLVYYYLKLMGHPNDSPDFLYAFYANYAAERRFGLNHIWSVSCEMHFYLLSPLLFWLGTRWKVVSPLLMGLGLLALFSCTVIHVFSTKNLFGLGGGLFLGIDFTNKYTTHIAVWPMLFGFIWQLYGWKVHGRVVKYCKGRVTILLVAFHIGMIAILALEQRFLTSLVAMGLIPLLLLTFQENLSIKGSMGKGLVWLGQRTYSIYLVQQLLTVSSLWDLSWRPLGALASVFVGAVFYYLVEKRFIK